ncbi:hypothetical protein DNTS_031512 [Danionella cerebrum]|uniref:Fibroblast growth factor n=1 Tax=Danionella cerebrum TaxID=2873325 RepID=A0A553RNM4_9TELE|nr:hypothetical protein DNTS_031512 [Danionella translucida]
MGLRWMSLCSILLFLCVCCLGVDEGAGSPGEHGDQLRRMWLHSMRNAKNRQKAAVEQASPFRGLATHQLLYSPVGIGFHLQILTNGSVGGVHEPSEYSLLKVFAVRPGIVGIRGVKSELYLCMSRQGIVQGLRKFSNECLFKEHMEENHYNTYSSLSHVGLFLALSHRGQLRKGHRVGRHQASTHFLPRKPLPH